MMREAPGRGGAKSALKPSEVEEDSGSEIYQPLPPEDEDPAGIAAELANVDRSKQRRLTRRSTMHHLDFVLDAVKPDSDLTASAGMTSSQQASPLITTGDLATDPDVQDVAISKVTAEPEVMKRPADFRSKAHTRVVTELFHAEDDLVCSLQDAVSTCETRLAQMRQLAEEASEAADLGDTCWKIIDAMAQQSSQAAALQGEALALLRTLQREEGERPRYGSSGLESKWLGLESTPLEAEEVLFGAPPTSLRAGGQIAQLQSSPHQSPLPGRFQTVVNSPRQSPVQPTRPQGTVTLSLSTTAHTVLSSNNPVTHTRQATSGFSSPIPGGKDKHGRRSIGSPPTQRPATAVQQVTSNPGRTVAVAQQVTGIPGRRGSLTVAHQAANRTMTRGSVSAQGSVSAAQLSTTSKPAAASSQAATRTAPQSSASATQLPLAARTVARSSLSTTQLSRP